MYSLHESSNEYEFILDKTPRYYHILDEIIEWVFESKVILLKRNPLAVMASIINSNFDGNWKMLNQPDRVHDLITAPKKINDALKNHSKFIFSLKYEDLVSTPSIFIRRVYNFLGLEFEENSLNYGKNFSFDDMHGKDRKSLHLHQTAVTDYKDQWVDTYRNQHLNYIARQYLEILGDDLLDDLGYPADLLLSMLPKLNRKPFNAISWHCLTKPKHERNVMDKFKLSFSKLRI